MANYSQYQGPNPEWEDFTRTTELPPPGLAPGQTPAELRDARNAIREKTSEMDMKASGLLENVTWQDAQVPTRDKSTIPARIYKPRVLSTSTPLPVYLFFHGGGYLYGSIDSENANCAHVVAPSPSPLVVVHINYRHTPEFKHPTQYNDAWDSFLWLNENITSLGGDPRKVVIGGISAGGGLAASVVLRAHEQESSPDIKIKIAGQVLLIPWLIHPKAYPFDLFVSKELSSYFQNANAPILPWSNISMFIDIFDTPDTNPVDIHLSTGLTADEQIRGMPKAVVVAAGMDPLRDEALLYADKLERNGVPVDVHIFPGLPHGFRRFENLKASVRWDEIIVEGIQWCLSDNDMSGTKIELP